MGTQLTIQELAQIERTALNFFKVHPDLRLEANKDLLLDYMEANMSSPAIPENWEISLLANYERLGKRPKEIVPTPEPPPVGEETPPPFIVRDEDGKTHRDPYWTTERLRAAIREEYKTEEKPIPVLPAEFTAQRITKMSATEIRRLARDTAIAGKFGADERIGMIAINSRLQGAN